VWKFSADSPIWTFLFFQVVFVANACTIASGAMAERTKFTGYLCYAVILSGLIYPVFGHWAWGSFGGGFETGFGGSPGWLENFGTGFYDFAGSTVVHGIGGATALAGIIIVGPRVGRFDKDGNPRYLPGHNLPLVCFGTLGICIGAFFVALILFKVIDTFVGLRVSDEEQEDGLDFTEHSVNAYADFQTTEN
jgi:Amt family ammonium transporter